LKKLLHVFYDFTYKCFAKMRFFKKNTEEFFGLHPVISDSVRVEPGDLHPVIPDSVHLEPGELHPVIPDTWDMYGTTIE
jgi:hypothetical protein